MARRSVVQNIRAERNALRDSLKSGAEGGANNRYGQGTNIPSVLSADPATRQLLQEQIYMRAYGTGRPTFTTAEQRYGGSSPTPTATRQTTEQRYGVMTPGQQNPTSTQPVQQPNIYDQLMTQINSRYGDTEAFDEDAARTQSMSDLQNRIDAIKAKYVGVVNEEQRQGEGRLGQQRGLSTISGTRFSPRGAAEQTNVETANQQAIDAINADMNAEIAAATAEANGILQQEIRYRGEQSSRQADSYLQNMLSAYGLYQGDRAAEQEQAARYAQMTGMYGDNPTLALRQYLSDTQNQRFSQDLQNRQYGQSERELQAKIQQAQQKNYSIQQLDDGTVVAFDPQTGQMTKLGSYAKQPTYSGGGSSSRYSDPTSTAAMQAYYQAYGTLPSESLMPYYANLYAGSAQPFQGPGYDYGSYSSYSNPFLEGAQTYDTRYGRSGADSSDSPYGSSSSSSGGGYYDDNGVWHP